MFHYLGRGLDRGPEYSAVKERWVNTCVLIVLRVWDEGGETGSCTIPRHAICVSIGSTSGATLYPCTATLYRYTATMYRDPLLISSTDLPPQSTAILPVHVTPDVLQMLAHTAPRGIVQLPDSPPSSQTRRRIRTQVWTQRSFSQHYIRALNLIRLPNEKTQTADSCYLIKPHVGSCGKTVT